MKNKIFFLSLFLFLILLINSKKTRSGTRKKEKEVSNAEEDKSSEEEIQSEREYHSEDKEEEKSEESEEKDDQETEEESQKEDNNEFQEEELVAEKEKEEEKEKINNIKESLEEEKHTEKEKVTKKLNISDIGICENCIELSLNKVKDKNFYIYNFNIGSDNKIFPLLIDTSTPETWVPSSECNCYAPVKYYSYRSQNKEDDKHKITISSFSGELTGLKTLDKIKFTDSFNNSNKKIEIINFVFAEIFTYSDNYSEYADGKLGLGFNYQDINLDFISELLDEKLINNSVFYFNTSNDKLYIGDIPSKLKNVEYPKCNVLSDDDTLKKIQYSNYKNSWICQMPYLTLGNLNNNISEKLIINTLNSFIIEQEFYENFESFVVFDSSSNYIYAPYEFFSYFEGKLFSIFINNTCTEIKDSNNEILIVCNSKLFNKVVNLTENLTLSFFIDGYCYNIKIIDLFEKINNNQYLFNIKFRQNKNNIWVLGMPFLKLYTVIFNKNKGEVGIIGNYLDVREKWNKWLKIRSSNKFHELIIAGSILIFILLITFFIWMFYMCCCNSDSDNNNGEKKKFEDLSSLIKNEERKENNNFNE